MLDKISKGEFTLRCACPAGREGRGDAAALAARAHQARPLSRPPRPCCCVMTGSCTSSSATL